MVKAFHACKQEDGQSVSPYLLKMKGYLETLEHLGYHMPKELDHRETIVELHAMLKLHEKGIPKKTSTIAVLAISGGLRESRKLKHGALSLYVGNGMRATVEAIRSFDLVLPSGLIIVLDNYHFAPTITRGVVSLSCSVNDGYIHIFMNYGISVSKDDVFYLNAIPRDGVYEIDKHNLHPNVSSIYNVSNKRSKHALDSSHLWHCRLGHINKKRMEKLQRDGILQPTHDESFDKYKSYISEKMASVSREGASYFITFTNDFRCYDYVYLMKHKHEHGKPPKLSCLRIWRCEALMKRDMLDKLDSRSIKCFFVGCPQETIDMDVEPHSVKVPIRTSERISQEPDRYGFYVDVEEHELGDLNEPPSYKFALSDPESDRWLDAMNAEMQFMKDNQVWCLLDLPPNGRSVGSK
ncbi:retrotransposon protein, putative, ty1-copia subclass [Tanacetum coccineum]